MSAGRPDYATQAIEEYKLALDADPTSTLLQDGLAELYFKIGRILEAVNAAKDQVKRNPDDIEAHTLAGAGLSAFSGRNAGRAIGRDAEEGDHGIFDDRAAEARRCGKPSCCWGSCMR